jgi:hypothetical protein
MLSLSQWRSEAALVKWREVLEHRIAQQQGRDGVFADYRIRVARLVATGGDLTVVKGAAPAVGAGTQSYTNIADAGHLIALVEGSSPESGTHWEIIRDYGMHERASAPRP